MHRSRINGILIDCNVEDIETAAQFWAEALGRPVEPDHPGTRGDYVMLENRPDEIAVQIQRVDHESRIRPRPARRLRRGCAELGVVTPRR